MANKLKHLLPATALACSLLLSAACGKKSLRPDAYVSWIENPDNGLRSSKTIGDYTFTLQYKPAEYQVLRESHNPLISSDSLRKNVELMSGMQYYTLQIATKDEQDVLREHTEDNNEYYGRLQQFMDPMQQDIRLVCGTDTLSCLFFHYERNYGFAPYTNFLLGFSAPETGSPDRQLIYDDHIFGTGPVQISISGKSIAETPILLTSR